LRDALDVKWSLFMSRVYAADNSNLVRQATARPAPDCPEDSGQAAVPMRTYSQLHPIGYTHGQIQAGQVAGTGPTDRLKAECARRCAGESDLQLSGYGGKVPMLRAGRLRRFRSRMQVDENVDLDLCSALAPRFVAASDLSWNDDAILPQPNERGLRL